MSFLLHGLSHLFFPAQDNHFYKVGGSHGEQVNQVSCEAQVSAADFVLNHLSHSYAQKSGVDAQINELGCGTACFELMALMGIGIHFCEQLYNKFWIMRAIRHSTHVPIYSPL